MGLTHTLSDELLLPYKPGRDLWILQGADFD